jgi:xanthosine utilization system XapX-like protein
MSIVDYFSKKSNYLFIVILGVLAVGIILVTLFKFPPSVIALVGIISIVIGAIRDILNQNAKDIEAARNKDSEEAFRRMTEGRMETITKKISENKSLVERTQVLESEKQIWADKQRIFTAFIKKGVVKEESLLESLSQETFIEIYHFNATVPKKYLKLLPDGKKVMAKILDDLGFVPVGFGPGSYFFHVISTNSLPEELREPVDLEAYIKKMEIRSWKLVEKKLQEADPDEYKVFKEKERTKWNLIYFLSKVFPANLKVGYINYQNFDSSFLPYLARFSKKIKNVDKKRLEEIIHLASIEYFIDFIPSIEREIWLKDEGKIKADLKITQLFDYEKISEETWIEIASGLFDKPKAIEYGKGIYTSIKRDLPIIREFL